MDAVNPDMLVIEALINTLSFLGAPGEPCSIFFRGAFS
jgi:hypothetical protein